MILVPFENDLRVFGGLDLSTKWDLTAWCTCQRVEDVYRFNWRYFISRRRADDIESKHRVEYATWIDQGFITLSGDMKIRYRDVLEHISEDIEQYKIQDVAYDPWNADKLDEDLEHQYGVKMHKCTQGYSGMSAAIKEFYGSYLETRIKHGNNPVTNWCAGNVEVQPDKKGNIILVKSDDPTKRIDGIVAAVMALKLAMQHPDEDNGLDLIRRLHASSD